MKVVVWVPGRARPRALEAAEKIYAERLALVKVDVVSYRVERMRSGMENQAQIREGIAFLKQLRADDFVVICDERGSMIETADVVKILRQARAGSEQLSGRGRLILQSAGPMGFQKRCEHGRRGVVAVGFAMAGGIALVLSEALYRGAMVLEGHPYHNE